MQPPSSAVPPASLLPESCHQSTCLPQSDLQHKMSARPVNSTLMRFLPSCYPSDKPKLKRSRFRQPCMHAPISAVLQQLLASSSQSHLFFCHLIASAQCLTPPGSHSPSSASLRLDACVDDKAPLQKELHFPAKPCEGSVLVGIAPCALHSGPIKPIVS